MVPGVGSPVLTNQACKARLEYCKRVIAPVLGAHHEHPGKVAGAIWCDCVSSAGRAKSSKLEHLDEDAAVCYMSNVRGFKHDGKLRSCQNKKDQR